MTYDAQPTYAEKASEAPIRVRQHPAIVHAMYFSGGAEQATKIIDWVLLNDGTATWSEAYDGFEVESADGGVALSVADQPEHLSVRTPKGVVRAPVGSWIIQNTDGEFLVVDQRTFRHGYGHL